MSGAARNGLLRRPLAIKLLRDLGDPRSSPGSSRRRRSLLDSSTRTWSRSWTRGSTATPIHRHGARRGTHAPRGTRRGGSARFGASGRDHQRSGPALGFAHEHGVIHRDVKRSNVQLPPGGVKLVDMGSHSSCRPRALTATLTLRGTARYTSPEQARGDVLDSRADLYSLGCVLFEMLVGQPPFEGDLGALSYAHARCPAPRVRPHRPIGSARWTSSSPPRSRRISGRPPAERSRCADVS